MIKRTIAAVVLFMSTTLLGGQVKFWRHASEADFTQGEMLNVVVTNLGDLKLGRAVASLHQEDPRISAVYALAEAPDGTIYAGTGPQGILLMIQGDEVTTAADLGDGVSITALLFDAQGTLLIGTAGQQGRVLSLKAPGDPPRVLFEAEDVQYIWAMTQTSDGMVYLATGPNGRLYELSPDGKHRIILDLEENNLLSMVSDGKDQLYIGTDPNGLVYRVDRRTGEAFVLYDADETEISALALDDKGHLYAGTAVAIESGVVEATARTERLGRPEQAGGDSPIPGEPPAPPQPPDLPDLPPDGPPPIPSPSFGLRPGALAGDEPHGQPMTSTGPAVIGPTSPGGVFAGGQVPVEGNAIYRISPEGFVSEIFRQQVMVFSIVFDGSGLLVGTGTNGQVFRIDPDAEELVAVAKVDAKDVMTLLPLKDGRVVMGLANTGEIAVMSSGLAERGSYTSAVLDASQISRFGTMQLRGLLPVDSGLSVQTRSGNLQNPMEPGWSPWSEEIEATEYLPSQAPNARFFQYRLNFTPNPGNESPVVEEVVVAYQTPNLPPKVASIQVAPASENQQGTGTLNTTWEASDPNEDELEYSIHFRSGTRGPWILIKQDLSEPNFAWNTRLVGDGRYQLRVTASDAKSNETGAGLSASRVSETFVVDNTPPMIGNLQVEVKNASAHIEVTVADRTSTVRALAWALNSADDWQNVLPVDRMADSPQEHYRFVVENLPAGANVLTLRATDAAGNQAFQTLRLTVDPPQDQ